MMARIPYELLCGVVLNLIDMSIYSDGITLEPVNNPIVGDPFEIKCNTDVNVINTVAITAPDSTIVGSCNPAISPFPASCINDDNYKATLDEATHTLTVNTSNLQPNVGGVWTCTHNFTTDVYNLTLIDIKGLRSSLSPESFPQDITSETPVSLSATYECIDTPVRFEWFAMNIQDNSSPKIALVGTNPVEVNESLCTAYLGFDAYTQTYSSSYVKGLYGSYRIGVEVHYSGEVTALQSIQYFNTYFIFSPSTTTSPSTDATTPEKTNGGSKDSEMTYIYIATGVVVFIIIITIIVTIIVCVRRRKTKNRRGQTGNNSSNPVHLYTQKDHHVDYDGNYNSGKPERVSSMSNKPPVDDDRRNDRNSQF